MLLTLYLFGVVISYFTLSWLWRRFKKSGRDPPIYPGSLPIIGHAHIFLGDTAHLWKLLVEISNVCLEKGGLTTISIGTWTLYVITDPESCFTVANTCLDKDRAYDFAKPLLGEGLVTAKAMTWKRHRKLINPAFSQHVLDGYLTVFNSQSRKLAENLAKEAGQRFFNQSVYLDRTSLDIICLTAMGINEKDELLDNVHFMEAVDEICRIYVKRVQNAWMKSDFLYKFSKLSKREDYLIQILHNMSNQVIQKRKSVISASEHDHMNHEDIPKKFKSFLDLLLELSVDGALSDSEIREEVDTMIIAGYDTTSTLLTYAMVLLGSFPDVQEKVYKELQEVFEGTDRDVDKHDLPKLVYLEAVLKEVLRLYPVIPIIARQINRDVELKNHTLPAGNSCFLHIYGMNRHPLWGADRMQFRPDRWLNPGEVPNLPTGFVGFGVGRRSCIGQRFSFMSAKTTLSHVLRRYRIEADHTKMILKIDVLLKPVSGHHIRIYKR